ncbi:RNA recognition motif domain protein family protein [Cryptosporidium meleagridis]|uniref:RNA recognition motif domain protein family protein n=1 Tax=Cryptosporidium meleagridis TaxID=93969 RepID=A0A2P4Z2N8_9CRYT|nr:RNA recognition motif domain protein family protein [Cryptosporidium meleagridis]
MFRSGPYSQSISSNNDNRLFLNSNYQNYSIQYQGASKNPCQHVITTDLDVPFTETYISRTLYLCKLPYDMTEDSVRELCEPFGDLKKVTVYPRKGIAFVEYFDIRKAEGARNTLKSSLVQGRIIDAQYSRGRDGRLSRDINTGTLYIKPIVSNKTATDPNTEDDYKELFCAYGEVKKVSSNRKRESEKFVEFYDIRGAEASQKALNGYDFNGVILEIQFANTHSRTLNSDSRATRSGRSSGICDRSFCISSEGRYKQQPSLNTKKKCKPIKCGTSRVLKRLAPRDALDCELYSEFSKRSLNRNDLRIRPDFRFLCQSSAPQATNNLGEFGKFPIITQRTSDDSTRTGNIVESLKTLLSTFKRPKCDNECNDSKNNAC